MAPATMSALKSALGILPLPVAACLVLALPTPWLRAAKPAWKPVPAEQLAGERSTLEPDAPAEVIFWSIDVNDRGFPRERVVTQYIRFKIFDPEKTDAITRVSNLEVTGSQDRTELHARLVLPNGQVRDFGREAIKERPLVQQARPAGLLGWLAGSTPSVVEKFLAVTGVERGSVLEYHLVSRDQWPRAISALPGQRDTTPVRLFEYRCQASSDTRSYGHRIFVTNGRDAVIDEDAKERTVSVRATDLPSVTVEPFSGPATDHVLTVISCYDQTTLYVIPRTGKVKLPGTVEPKHGPWAPYATLMNWVARDRGLATKRVKLLADELARGAADDLEKARRIHRHVEAQWQLCRKRDVPAHVTTFRDPNSLDDVLGWEKAPDVRVTHDDFLWLALSLYQAAGLEAHAVMLPNREVAHFDPTAVSAVFLPHVAAAIRIGGEWRFSSPHYETSHPFGMLPWQLQGQPGLLALERKQEFLRVPVSPPDHSGVLSMAAFELEADGALRGEIVRRFTGLTAAALRADLRAATDKDRVEIARTRLGFDPKIVELTVKRTDGLDDAEKPLEIAAEMRWPDFAARTKDRIILRPSVFRAEASSSFPSSERKRPVYFPFRWHEIDRVAIRLPEGFEFETPSAPPSMAGDALRYRLQIAIEAEKRLLHVQREFLSNMITVPLANYPALKESFDRIARNDQHEMVLRKSASPPADPRGRAAATQ